MDQPQRTIIGLQRASGGLGSSTLAAAVAALAAETGPPSLLVDLAPHGGGLDALIGCGHEPGLRWPALDGRGEGTTAAQLPAWGGVRVLSHGIAVPSSRTLDGWALRSVLRLAERHPVTVLDLPSPDHPRAPSWWHLCDTVVLLTGCSPVQVAAALVLRPALPRLLGVVTRPSHGGELRPDDVSALLGATWVGALEDDPDASRAQLDQRAPGTEPGPLRAVAAAILAEVAERRGGGAAA